jgi:hypothetical protein
MRRPNNTIDFYCSAWSNYICEISPNKSFEFFSYNNETKCQKSISCPLYQLLTLTYSIYGRISIRKCQFGN